MRLRVHALALLVIWCHAGRADLLPDDHGDEPNDATAMTAPSNRVTGVIDYDLDVDVFSFPFQQFRTYRILISTNTLWDAELEVMPPLRDPLLLSTNTVWTNAPLEMAWSNMAASRWYLSISGMFQFTTGSYQLSVWEWPTNQDSDADGLSDAWETNYFGNLSSANATSVHLAAGFTDLDAYLAGVNPTSGLPLVVVDLDVAPGEEIIQWPREAYASYEIQMASEVTGTWVNLGQQVSDANPEWGVWTNVVTPGAGTNRYYRIRLTY